MVIIDVVPTVVEISSGGREFRDADQLERHRSEPERQRRLSPEGNAILNLRHYPLAGFEHFAGDFAIPSLGAIGQRVSTDCQQADNKREDE